MVVQDGIYWIRDFPDHEISRLLLQVMPPNYQAWAKDTRKKIAEDELKANEVLTSNLNDSTKAAMVLLMDTFKESYKNVKHDLHQMEIRINAKIDEAIYGNLYLQIHQWFLF